MLETAYVFVVGFKNIFISVKSKKILGKINSRNYLFIYVTSTDGTYSVINKAAGVAKKSGAKEATSQWKDIQKTLNEKPLCYNFVILFQTNNKIITNVYIFLFLLI